MGLLGDIGKALANSFLDQYESAGKKTGNASAVNSARILRDYNNGKIDQYGNPIRKSYDDDDEW